MKYTTARRIIKESKKGAAHPEDLVNQAHAVCHTYHDLRSRGKMAEAELVEEVKKQQDRLKEAGKPIAIIPADQTPEEFASRQVRLGRQGRLDPSRVAHARGKIQSNVRIDPEGKPIKDENGVIIMNYDPMGNASIAKIDMPPIKMVDAVGLK